MDGEYDGMIGKRFKIFALAIYALMLITMVIVASLVMDETRDLVLIILIAVVLALILFTNRSTLHIPRH